MITLKCLAISLAISLVSCLAISLATVIVIFTTSFGLHDYRLKRSKEIGRKRHN